MPALADAFLKNRADNLPPDVFQEFIVPPFFQHISIFQDKKSVRVLGGRGCGKTMFLKFLCHGSTFSGHREDIGDEAFSNLGLYFRPDTGFCSLMTPEWLQGQRDGHAFSHYLTLSLVAEICEAIKTIDAAENLANGPLSIGDAPLGMTLVSQFGLPEPSIKALREHVEQGMAKFDLWVRNPDHCDAPQFVNFSFILTALANDLAKHSPRLESLAFRVFVDEFENLLPRHREIICDVIKHPTQRIVVHIAHKRDAVTDLKTSGVERIAELHDIRTIDLESYLVRDSDFDVLAAELFLFRIYQADGVISCPAFRPDLLHDPKHLAYRLTENYRQDVVNCVKQILPELSAPEIARMALQDPPLRQRIGKMIKKGLEFQGLDRTVEVDDLINESVPEATVVLGAILNRKTQSGKEALSLFKQVLVNGRTKTDPFHKQGGWVDNNLYGCLFHLYAGLPRRPNILYSGFSRFCKIAAPNLRFFQELCHITLLLGYQRKSANDIGEPLRVDYDIQATAVKQVSDAMFGDIMQLGPQGYRLLEFARRLGGLFEAYNRRRSQSEPEINHFSINEADTVGLSTDAQTILREAKIWSVLRETKDTKNKADADTAQFELVLNAIYAPHFRISYRKRRKITLTAAELDIILTQSDSSFETLVKQLVDSQDDDITAQITGSLF